MCNNDIDVLPYKTPNKKREAVENWQKLLLRKRQVIGAVSHELRQQLSTHRQLSLSMVIVGLFHA